MAKYKLHECRSITIKGNIFKKIDNPILDGKVYGEERLAELAKAGHLIDVSEKAKPEVKAKTEPEKKAKTNDKKSK